VPQCKLRTLVTRGVMLDSSQLLSACRHRSFPTVRRGEIIRECRHTWHTLASMANRAKRKRAIFCILLGFDTMDLVFKRSVDCGGAKVQLPYAENERWRLHTPEEFPAVNHTSTSYLRVVEEEPHSCAWPGDDHVD
jgi:hypothetical protein